jgi:hypothetical protein
MKFWEEQNRPRRNFFWAEKFQKIGRRISVGMGEIESRYRYLNIEAGAGDHLCGRCRRGSAADIVCGMIDFYGCSIEATAAAEYGLPLGVVYP